MTSSGKAIALVRSDAVSQPQRPIVFYDGECGLCHRTVRWLVRHDRRQRLRYAPLQGPTYKAVADATKPVALDTIVTIDDRGLHVRSDATLAGLRAIGGWWSVIAVICRLVPRP